MAKGILKKVAQRVIHSHYKSSSHSARKSSSYSAFPPSVEQNAWTEPQHGTPGHTSLWMRPSSSSIFPDPVAVAQERFGSDEDLKNQLLSPNAEIEKSTRHKYISIDTHAMVKLLMERGFSSSQAEVLTKVMVEVTQNNAENLQATMVSKPQAEISLQKIAGQLAVLRQEMLIMEKTDFTQLVTKIERITYELEQLQRTLKDEINRVAGNLTLDLNLEKGKVKDMHIEHLTAIEGKHAKIFDKIIGLEKELQNTRSYITTENAALQTVFERYKSDTMKLAFGAVATCMTIVLGFYRLWS